MMTQRRNDARHKLVWSWIVAISVAACGTADLDDSADPANGKGGAGGTGGTAGHVAAESLAPGHDPTWDPPNALEIETTLATAPVSNATACTSGSQCPTGYCVDGFCCDSKCDNKCMACSAAKKGSGSDGICGSIKYDTDPDNDCPYGACDGKNMCKNYNGFSCTAAAQCLSNYCVDGFCCNNICMGSCQACSAAKKGSGQDGLCGSIKAATDPDNECSNSDCNGSGACTTSPQPTFPNGTACTSAAQCASGYCADGVCCDSWCLGSCQACTAAKKNQGTDGTCGNIANDKDPDEECWGGACNGAGVCKQYNGVPCVDKTQCLSNYCVDGFCCGNICTGWCYACSEARKGGGYDGACGPILSGRDPDNECSPGECNGSGTCNQTQTPLTNGTACIASAQCASGNCVDGFCCDTACTGTCKACSAAKKGSGANGTCGTIASETDPDSECGVGGRCGGNGTCRYYNGAVCTSTAQCFSNYCADGVCCGNICNQTCNACSAAKKGQGVDGACGPIANTRDPDNECNPGECNGSSACNQAQTPQANGAACAGATQCVSGNCVDGVCCDTACTASCQACSAAKKGQGTSGTCGPIKYDTDPDNECPTGACSGTATCQSYNGFSCTQTTQCLSNYCVDGVCCGNICTNSCMACTAAKKGSGQDGVCGVIANNTDPDNECGLTCNGAGACVKAPNGATCTLAADCTSGLCVDGYCCNSTCVGSCNACNVAGSLGTCSNSCASACTGTVGLPRAPLSAPSAVLAGNNRGIDAADFDNNGKQDVVVINQSGSASVFMGQGNLTLGAPSTLTLAANPAAVATGDLNADGFADIIVASNGTGGVSVFLNQGNGTFAPKVDYATGSVNANYAQPDMLRIADVNGDGKLDIATANASAGTVSLLLGQGNGTFPNKVDIAAGLKPAALAIADYNGDSIVDLAVTTQAAEFSDYRVSIMMGQGGGAFGAATHINTPDYQGFSLITADINGDGRRDLVTGNRYSGYSYYDHKLYVLLNQGNGTFAAAVPYDVSAVGRIATTNLNGDAFADVVVATDWLESIAVYLGQANGTLTTPVEYPTHDDAFSLVAADLDNDNDKDIVTANVDSLSVLGNSATGTFGDIVNPDPKIAMSGGDLLSGDFNGDGLLDLVSFASDVSSNSTIAISLGQGGGNFIPGTPQAFMSSPFFPTGYAMGDMNGDTKPDLVYCYEINGVCYIRLYQGNGTFGAATTINFYNIFDDTMGATGPILGDVDGNGTLDLAVSRSYTEQSFNGLRANIKTLVWLNPGNGVLGSPVTQTHYTSLISSGSEYKRPTAGGDFNGDGKFDLAISSPRLIGTRILLSNGDGNFTSGGLLPEVDSLSSAHLNGDGAIDLLGTVLTNGQYVTNTWLNTGGGMFATGVAYPDLMGILPMTGDVNSDGKLDFVYKSGGNKVSVKLNQGSGVYGSPKAYIAGVGASGVILSDLNDDGRLDMVLQNYKSSSITIHLNSCLP